MQSTLTELEGARQELHDAKIAMDAAVARMNGGTPVITGAEFVATKKRFDLALTRYAKAKGVLQP